MAGLSALREDDHDMPFMQQVALRLGTLTRPRFAAQVGIPDLPTVQVFHLLKRHYPVTGNNAGPGLCVPVPFYWSL